MGFGSASAAFGFANRAILAVGGLFFQPLIGILAKMKGLDAPDAESLSVLIWAQGVALFLLMPPDFESLRRTEV
jgi:hypothetical protein